MRGVPQWLEEMLSASFFSECQTHCKAARSECNMYCLDCNVNPFCLYCRSSIHKDHQVIQIRRSSYHDVVRVTEIHKVLDISGVQTYVINSARVMFLNVRRQPKNNGKGGSHLCEICNRSLLDPFRFCSLGCKLVGIKRNGDASFCLDAKKEEEEEVMQRGEGIVVTSQSSTRELGDQLGKGMRNDKSTPSNTRRRKGIPRRAPFGL